MYSQKLRIMESQQEAQLANATAIRAKAELEGRSLTDTENNHIGAHVGMAKRLEVSIAEHKANNSLAAVFEEKGPEFFLDAGRMPTAEEEERHNPHSISRSEHPRAAAFRKQFAAWMSNTLSIVGGSPQMGATAPTGIVSVGSGTGLDSIGITVPTSIMPYLSSYFALDSFGLAGSTQFYTDHTRPMTQPVLSAGAADAVYAENAGPGTSQPFGLSGFTFGGTKYARLVLASYESLMNSELPLQGAIMDELLASLATTLTTATTTQLYTALTAASSTLEVGTGGSNDIYSSLTDLRHAVPPRYDLPTNRWMLSRSTLATIRNKRASTSGVPMFDPESDTIFGRPYVINDNFDTVCGAGFVTYGSWRDGAFLRRTPVMTRVFLELYAQNNQIGYRTTQWADSHFMAELVGSAQPPTFQPLYYTSIASES